MTNIFNSDFFVLSYTTKMSDISETQVFYIKMNFDF